mgnify:CR=1 FL=1
MKLVHKNIEKHLEFKENKVNVLVVENNGMLFKLINELQSQIEGENGTFVLSENGELLNISKEIELITDVFSLNLNERTSVNRLLNSLTGYTQSAEMINKSRELQMVLNEYLSELTQNEELPVSFADEINMQSLLKALGVEFENEYNSICEKLLVYMRIMNRYFQKEVFVLVNLKTFVNEDELKDFYQNAFYEKLNLLLFESTERKSMGNAEEVTVIDKDMCEVR